MMRHCRQCRADAVGLLGEDRSAEFTTDKIMAMEVNYDLDTRKAYQEKVEEERRPRSRRNKKSLNARRRDERHQDPDRRRHQGPAAASTNTSATPRSSRSTSSAPRARSSSVIAASISIARAAWRGRQPRDVIRAINDCHAVFVAKIGGCPKAI
jgi:nitrogen fixation protein NifB